MSVGELAAKADVPASTLRYYDAIGLVVAQRGPGGHRRYPPGAVELLELVGLCRAAGFSLDEIAVLIAARDAAARRVLATAKLHEIDEALVQLAQVRAVVAHFARCSHGPADREACERAVRAARTRVAPTKGDQRQQRRRLQNPGVE